jgi:hypothetical protein
MKIRNFKITSKLLERVEYFRVFIKGIPLNKQFTNFQEAADVLIKAAGPKTCRARRNLVTERLIHGSYWLEVHYLSSEVKTWDLWQVMDGADKSQKNQSFQKVRQQKARKSKTDKLSRFKRKNLRPLN